MNKYHYIKITAVTTALLFSMGFAYAQIENEEPQRRIGESRQAMQELRVKAQERVKEAQESLKQRVDQVKDQAKKDAAHKISGQFDHVNAVWTDHFMNVLDRLDAILDKIKSRRDKANQNGQNVSTVNVAIFDAENTINSARLAVQSQAQKTYVLDVSSIPLATGQNSLMSQLRDKFKEMRNSLFSDLMGLRDGPMKDARNSVRDAFKSLVEIPGIDEEPETN